MIVFYQLTRNTFRECLREPVFFLILATALFLIASFPVCTFFSFQRQLWTVLESCMAATMFLGFTAAILSANTCVRREMQNGTMLLLLSKPVSRVTFIVAKAAGIMGAMLVFSVICCTATALMTLVSINAFQFDQGTLLIFLLICACCGIYGAVRNYLSGASFPEHCTLALFLTLPVYYLILYRYLYAQVLRLGPEEINMVTFVPFSGLFPVLMLLVLAILLMGMIAAAMATRFSFLTNLIFCLGIFLGGLVSGPGLKALFGKGSFLAALSNALIPNWQHFWMANPLVHGYQVPGAYVLWMLLYVFIYGSLWILWAGAGFYDTELAKDSRI